MVGFGTAGAGSTGTPARAVGTPAAADDGVATNTHNGFPSESLQLGYGDDPYVSQSVHVPGAQQNSFQRRR